MMRSKLVVSACAALALSGVTASVVAASAPSISEPATNEAAAAAGWSVSIGGNVDSALSVTAADLAALPQQSQEATYESGEGESGDGAQTHTYEGPLLIDVLELATPSFEAEIKNDKLSRSIIVTATDGYVAAVAWGEIDPDFENKPVLLAISEDGAALEGGPRLTVPGDQHGGRYVSDVVDIALVGPAGGAHPGQTAATTIGTDVATTGLAAGLEGDLTVFAAASLTDAFTEIGDAFAAENPDVDVTFNFAASSDLVNQINEGAPADVFASADQANMTKLTDEDGTAGEPATFATNTLEIIVEPGNPEGISGLEDLGRNPDLIVVSCAPEVPIGAYSQAVFENAGVDVELDSLEENVRAVVEKVVAGEADAGIVYATDVTAAGDGADGVEIPADVNVIAEYPIAAIADAPNADGAAAFEQFVLGAQGQEILASYGFGPA